MMREKRNEKAQRLRSRKTRYIWKKRENVQIISSFRSPCMFFPPPLFLGILFISRKVPLFIFWFMFWICSVGKQFNSFIVFAWQVSLAKRKSDWLLTWMMIVAMISSFFRSHYWHTFSIRCFLVTLLSVCLSFFSFFFCHEQQNRYTQYMRMTIPFQKKFRFYFSC